MSEVPGDIALSVEARILCHRRSVDALRGRNVAGADASWAYMCRVARTERVRSVEINRVGAVCGNRRNGCCAWQSLPVPRT